MAIPANLRSMVPPDRRDWALIMAGILALFVAYAYGVAPVPPSSRNPLNHATAILPLRAFALMWVAAGVYCIGAAFTDHRVGGFAVAGFMPVVWGSLYLICYLLGDPGRGWVATGYFWSFAGYNLLTGGLVDPRTWTGRRRL